MISCFLGFVYVSIPNNTGFTNLLISKSNSTNSHKHNIDIKRNGEAYGTMGLSPRHRLHYLLVQLIRSRSTRFSAYEVQ